MDMKPPVTPKSMPASAAKLPLDHINKLFGIVYITLMGVIDTIAPAASLWLWVGKSMSYLIKLASILWWALLTQSATHQFPNTSKPDNQGWFPDNTTNISSGSTFCNTEDDNRRALTAKNASAHSGVQTRVIFSLAEYKEAATSDRCEVNFFKKLKVPKKQQSRDTVTGVVYSQTAASLSGAIV
ncbi:hypothetical protein DSO57_1018247 [Entomophthora muscae]|uniref:Uncharacterized protein n=1 Tax=Entomophthora muscae TaxID=34485 RepID=A0ACC2SHR6_9FUNG|nr:hypothetical protein DSO57_1018247 [Entomophthora muscae]